MFRFHFLCCYDQKQQTPKFSHLLFFVAICCRNNKMLPKCCPTIKKHFLFKKIFSKSISDVSKYKKVTLVLRGGNADTTYVFASYMVYTSSFNISSCQRKSVYNCNSNAKILFHKIPTKWSDFLLANTKPCPE